MIILGISGFYHDSAAALVEDGRVVAAAQEERFTRRKHDARFPGNAIRYCLEERGVTLRGVDRIAFYERPSLKFDRVLKTTLAVAPAGHEAFREVLPLWLGERSQQTDGMIRALEAMAPGADVERKLRFTEHHLSHAASAFYPSPFERAAILTMDGVGEWATTTIMRGDGSTIEPRREVRFPHSLGLLYTALTYFLGFKPNSGEYKVMGLAPYGEPRFARRLLDTVVDLREDGSFGLDQRYFNYCTGLTMTGPAMEELLGVPRRTPEQLLEPVHMDIAASLQAVTEEAVLQLARAAVRETGERRLCLAGGVALNCVANGKLLRSGAVDDVWIQPAAGDAGGALGSALAIHYLEPDRANAPARTVAADTRDAMAGAYLGPAFGDDEIRRRLDAAGARYAALDREAMLDTTVSALADGQAVGWFQGRMEFGPRALGSRSILGDPRSPTMQRDLNLKVKYRESFRPFAPSVLRERVADWFEFDHDSPYMLLVDQVREELRRAMTPEEEALFGIDKLNVQRSTIPAVTHIDYSARIQTVHADTNPLYHELIRRFEERTGCPVLINTSFNVRGEPIVCTPEDAFRCFMGTELDLLAVGNCVLRKPEQDAGLAKDYRDQFEPD